MRANDTVLVNTSSENEFISIFISIYIYLVRLFELSNCTRKFSSDSDYSFLHIQPYKRLNSTIK